MLRASSSALAATMHTSRFISYICTARILRLSSFLITAVDSPAQVLPLLLRLSMTVHSWAAVQAGTSIRNVCERLMPKDRHCQTVRAPRYSHNWQRLCCICSAERYAALIPTGALVRLVRLKNILLRSTSSNLHPRSTDFVGFCSPASSIQLKIMKNHCSSIVARAAQSDRRIADEELFSQTIDGMSARLMSNLAQRRLIDWQLSPNPHWHGGRSLSSAEGGMRRHHIWCRVLADVSAHQTFFQSQ